MKKKVCVFTILLLMIFSILVISNYNNLLFKEVSYNQTIESGEYISIYINDGNDEYNKINLYSINFNLYDLVDSDCKNGSTVTIDDDYINVKLSGTDSCSLYFDRKDLIDVITDKMLTYNILLNSTTTTTIEDAFDVIDNNGTPNFTDISTVDNGIYATKDNYGTSYYFRGNVDNNYILFADMLWRIVRIDGEGSIKLMLFNESTTTNVYSGINNGTKYSFNNETTSFNAGYMYTIDELDGNDNSSNAKEVLESWYESTLHNTDYAKYISNTSIYCSDRIMINDSNNEIVTELDTSLSYYFNSYKRLSDTNEPSLVCSSVYDSFSANESDKGNGNLVYPVGLLTADELIFAGSVYGNITSNYYLNTSNLFYTMTPSKYISNTTYMFMESMGKIIDNEDTIEAMMYPIISLNYNVIYVGGYGTIDNPYTIVS